MMIFEEISANPLSIKRRGLVCGVGINDAPYMVVLRRNGKRTLCPYYRVWQNMLERCYGRVTGKNCPTYDGCSVAECWHKFMSFKAWMEKQDWQGKALDKDILVPGNKVYSPDACVFVSKRLNQLLCDSAGSRSAWSIGVKKHRNRFVAYIGGKNKGHIGSFDTPEEANAAYRAAKAGIIRKVASEQDGKLRSALLRHAQILDPRGILT